MAEISRALTDAGLQCCVYDDSDGTGVCFDNWVVTMDASISKRHQVDGFFLYEIVSPILLADDSWTAIIERMWSALTAKFECRQDSTCGFHVHISFNNGEYSLAQLRNIAKAIVFWEPATARCAPLSRRDAATSFCKSNIKAPLIADILRQHGPLAGLSRVYERIEELPRDEVIEFISPSKHFAWNMIPAKDGHPGSIKFRRPPGVINAKKAKHWIAFTMSFIWMATRFDLQNFVERSAASTATIGEIIHPDFLSRMAASARELGIDAVLDPRIQQKDAPTLHITIMTIASFQWLRQHNDPRLGIMYDWSPHH